MNETMRTPADRHMVMPESPLGNPSDHMLHILGYLKVDERLVDGSVMQGDVVVIPQLLSDQPGRLGDGRFSRIHDKRIKELGSVTITASPMEGVNNGEMVGLEGVTLSEVEARLMVGATLNMLQRRRDIAGRVDAERFESTGNAS